MSALSRFLGWINGESPVTPPAGRGVLFYDQDDLAFKQINDQGIITSLITLADFEVTRRPVLRGSSFNTQTPIGTDNPLQLEFGPPQNGPTDPVQSDALGNFTVNETGHYHLRLSAQYGRTGSGGTAWLYLRVLVNGVQAGVSVLAKVEAADSDFPYQAELTADLPAGAVFTVELWRGSEGTNAGGVFSITPAFAGANPNPSVDIIISQYQLTQV